MCRQTLYFGELSFCGPCGPYLYSFFFFYPQFISQETKYRRYLFPGDLRPIRGKYSPHVTSTKHLDQSEKRSNLLPRELTNKNLFLNIRWANKLLEAPFKMGLK